MEEIQVALPWLNPKVGMYTPWGPADYVTFLSPDKSVIKVGTCSHGGIAVHVATHPIPEHFKHLALCGETWAWFEEDCAWSAAVLMLPAIFSNEQQSAEETLRNWYPDAYAGHFGRMPTAAESSAVRSAELTARLKDNFTINATWGDWAWDVPKGKVYVLGRRSSDGAEAGFLMPAADYKSPVDEIVLDVYPRWEPDRTRPYQKPRGEQAATRVQEVLT